MTSLSDTLTVGLVLVLLFGSIALYLYTRLQQAEQKISLLESILLDLKMSAEIKSYSELPATENHQSNIPNDYTLFEEDDNNTEDSDTSNNTSNKPSIDVSSNSSGSTDSTQATVINEDADNTDETPIEKVARMPVNYESMSLKELQILAKTRGITGANSMKKGSIIEALKTSDRSSTPLESGHIFAGTSSSFIDTSSTI